MGMHCTTIKYQDAVPETGRRGTLSSENVPQKRLKLRRFDMSCSGYFLSVFHFVLNILFAHELLNGFILRVTVGF